MTNDLFPVAILVGGLATRLRPITESIPKSLIEVAGEPFIFHQLRLLKERGINRVVICAGYMGERIQNVVAQGEMFDLRIDYSFDGPELIGTAGAVRKALPLLGEKFFVMYGDSYLECDYASIQKTFLRSNKEGLMTIYRNEGQWDRSNVEFLDGNILRYDKKQQTPQMHYIDYGLGLFNKNVFYDVEKQTISDLPEIYQHLLAHNQLEAFECENRFYEIGSFIGIEELNKYILEKRKG